MAIDRTLDRTLDQNSSTWKTVERFIEEHYQEAVAKLITDTQSERQRGTIETLQALRELAEPKPTRINTPSGQY